MLTAPFIDSSINFSEVTNETKINPLEAIHADMCFSASAVRGVRFRSFSFSTQL